MLDDPWIALDKLEHLLFCAFIVVGTYSVCLRFITSRRAVNLSAAVLLSVLAAGAKELGDYLQWWPGNLSCRDFVADLAGTAIATTIILIVHKPQAASSSLAGLANTLRPGEATYTAAGASALTRSSYKALPTADIEMGVNTGQ